MGGALLPDREQFTRMLLGMTGVLMSGQHAGDLHHPLVVVEAADIRSSDVLILLLEHSQMGPGEGRHLRHMRDHDDLRVLGQLMQPPADGRGGRTSHTGVDLVEHERANRIGVGEHDGTRASRGRIDASGRSGFTPTPTSQPAARMRAAWPSVPCAASSATTT